MKIIKPSVTLLHATPDPLRVIERAGRICYQSTHKTRPCLECRGSGVVIHSDVLVKCDDCLGTGIDETGSKAFVRTVLKRGHESVIEHVSAGFLIVTDRGVTHELVRHRLSSFSQESTRYCNYAKEQFGNELSFIEPPNLGDGYTEWRCAVESAEARYLRLSEQGIKPEIARSVLPNSLKAEIAMTCNAREWRHFLRLRTSPAAHPQMREVAEMIREELVRWAPVLFEDLGT